VTECTIHEAEVSSRSSSGPPTRKRISSVLMLSVILKSDVQCWKRPLQFIHGEHGRWSDGRHYLASAGHSSQRCSEW